MHGSQQCLLVTEALIDRTDRDVCPGCDLLDCETLEAVLLEQTMGGIENPLIGLAAALLLGRADRLW